MVQNCERLEGDAARHFAPSDWLPAMKAWLAIRHAQYHASLQPQTPSEAHLITSQIAQTLDATRHYGLVVPAVSLLIAFYFRDTVPLPRLAIWWGIVTLLFGGGSLLIHNRKITPTRVPAEAGRIARQFTIVTTIQVLAWCAMVPVFWVLHDSLNHVVLVLIIVSSLACCSSVAAAHFASGRISMASYGLTLMLMPLVLSPGPNRFFFTALALVYWISMQLQLHANYNVTHKMLALEDERGALIDDLKQAKQDSDGARVRAEQASKAKSQFLANMSHELRTPLNAVLGFSDMMRSGFAAERQSEYAQLIHESGQHLLALIDDILDLAKIEAGSLKLKESEVDLPALIGECTHLMEQRAQTGRITLGSESAGALPLVFADERALRQILLNLLSNAIKFTQPGGNVTAFANCGADGAVMFGVRDTGIGIAEEDLQRVFETFGQGRHDIAITDQGTGLGLAIVKGLAEAHGGEIQLASHIGKGTTVSIRLPAARSRSLPPVQAIA